MQEACHTLSSGLYCANLPSLQHRRDQEARKLFKSIHLAVAPDSCLHSLLPVPRDKNLIARLRAARTFPPLASRTKRYQSFVNFAILGAYIIILSTLWAHKRSLCFYALFLRPTLFCMLFRYIPLLLCNSNSVA